MKSYLLVLLFFVLTGNMSAQCPSGGAPTGIELVTNGDFSSGNAGFTSGYNYTTSNYTEGEYSISTDVANWNGGMYSDGDHTAGDGNMLLVNGHPDADIDIWCQTITVTPNTDYVLSAWVSSFNHEEPHGNIQFLINGVQVGNVLDAPPAINTWVAFNATWNSGAATSVTLCIRDLDISRAANDFGIDDISFKACGCNDPINAGTLTVDADTICAGSSSALSVSGSTGTLQWQSSADGFLFTDLPGNTNTTYNTGDINLTTYYRVKVSGSCGADSSGSVAVNVIPLPDAGIISLQPDTVCEGTVAALNSTGASGNFFQWQSSFAGSNFIDIPGAVSNTYNTPFVSQTTSYRLIAGNGICTDTSALHTLVVNPAPAPPVLSQGDLIICASDSTQITSSGTYAAYLWNNGETGSYTTVARTGGYWVTVTDEYGCTAVSDRKYVAVHPVPSVAIIVQGDTFTSYGAEAYQWYLNGEPIPGATSATYIAHQAGSYSVEIVDANGCRTRSTDVNTTNVGIYESIIHTLRVYPNPASGEVFISTGDFEGELRMVNMLGQEMKLPTIQLQTAGIIRVDISALPAGVYEVMLYNHKQVNSAKLVIE